MDQLTRRVAALATLTTMLTSFIAGCGAAPSSEPAPLLGRAMPAPEACPPESVTGIVRPLSRRSLQWMGEPIIACGPFAEDEVYRFIAQSPDRSSSPLSVRLSRIEGQALLVARQYSWVSGTDAPQPLTIVTSKVRPVPTPEWEALTTALHSAGFWDMPADEGDAPSEAETLWDLEGRRGGGYHHVERRPSQQGPFRDLVRQVLTMAGYAERLD